MLHIILNLIEKFVCVCYPVVFWNYNDNVYIENKNEKRLGEPPHGTFSLDKDSYLIRWDGIAWHVAHVIKP